MKPIEAKLPFSCAYIDVQNDVSLVEKLTASGILKGIDSPKVTCTADSTNNIPVVMDEKDFDQLIRNLHRYKTPEGNPEYKCYFSEKGSGEICVPKSFFDDANGPFQLWAKGPKIKEKVEALLNPKSPTTNQAAQAVPVQNESYNGSVEGGSYKFDLPLSSESADLLEKLLRHYHSDPTFFQKSIISVPNKKENKFTYQLRFNVAAVKESLLALEAISAADPVVLEDKGNDRNTKGLHLAKELLDQIKKEKVSSDDLLKAVEALLTKPEENMGLSTKPPLGLMEWIAIIGTFIWPVYFVFQGIASRKLRKEFELEKKSHEKRIHESELRDRRLQLKFTQISAEEDPRERKKMLGQLQREMETESILAEQARAQEQAASSKVTGMQKMLDPLRSWFDRVGMDMLKAKDLSIERDALVKLGVTQARLKALGFSKPFNKNSVAEIADYLKTHLLQDYHLSNATLDALKNSYYANQIAAGETISHSLEARFYTDLLDRKGDRIGCENAIASISAELNGSIQSLTDQLNVEARAEAIERSIMAANGEAFNPERKMSIQIDLERSLTPESRADIHASIQEIKIQSDGLAGLRSLRKHTGLTPTQLTAIRARFSDVWDKPLVDRDVHTALIDKVDVALERFLPNDRSIEKVGDVIRSLPYEVSRDIHERYVQEGHTMSPTGAVEVYDLLSEAGRRQGIKVNQSEVAAKRNDFRRYIEEPHARALDPRPENKARIEARERQLREEVRRNGRH